MLQAEGMGPPDEGSLDAPMLVAQGDLQVEDGLAVALESEVAGFDHPGVDRSDGYLVDLIPSHLEEVRHARHRGFGPSPGVPGAPGAVVAHRFQPGMARWHDAELLGHLPFEEVGLGTLRSDGGEAGLLKAGLADPQPVPLVLRKNGEYPQIGSRTEAGQALAFLDGLEDLVPEGIDIELLQPGQGHGLAVAEGGESALAHGCPSTLAAALWSMSDRGLGSQTPSTSARTRAPTRGAVSGTVSR